MLEYVKTILSKVSFNRELFEKELKKSLLLLVPEELVTLKIWCYEQYSNQYPLVLQRAFVNV
jgi:hypothetical protein